jgi:hypothetical protein
VSLAFNLTSNLAEGDGRINRLTSRLNNRLTNRPTLTLNSTQGDGRIRVLLAHSPVDFMEVEGMGVVPSTFLLKDIVVIRERLNARPFNLDVDPDSMWVQSPSDAFEGSYSGTRQRLGLGLGFEL